MAKIKTGFNSIIFKKKSYLKHSEQKFNVQRETIGVVDEREERCVCFILQIIWCRIIFAVMWTSGNYQMQSDIIIRHERKLSENLYFSFNKYHLMLEWYMFSKV